MPQGLSVEAQRTAEVFRVDFETSGISLPEELKEETVIETMAIEKLKIDFESATFGEKSPSVANEGLVLNFHATCSCRHWWGCCDSHRQVIWSSIKCQVANLSARESCAVNTIQYTGPI